MGGYSGNKPGPAEGQVCGKAIFYPAVIFLIPHLVGGAVPVPRGMQMFRRRVLGR
jgi:hypothetical protein